MTGSRRGHAIAAPVALLALVVGAILVTSPASAQTATDAEARAAYDAGAVAYESRSFARAAALFAHADELAPNPLVLKLGLAAATQADDPLLGMTLVLRAESRAVDGSVADVARLARARFASRVGVVRVVCETRGSCAASVGGRRVAEGQLVAVPLGDVEAVFEVGELRPHVHAMAVARSVVDLGPPPAAVSAPPAAPPADDHVVHVLPGPPPAGEPPAQHGGLPSAVFWGGVVVTGLLGGATLASGVDTLVKHDNFTSTSSPSADERARGVSAEMRTNVLLGCTLGSLAVTGVLGLFFTRWHGADGPHAADAQLDGTIRF